MINLLPYDAKKQIRAARMNVVLMRYFIVIGLAALFLAAISGAVYVVLLNTQESAKALTAANESKAGAYGAVQTQIASFRASLSTAKSVIDQSVSYSNVLTGIARVVPSGVVLDNLNLSSATFGAPITLLAHARTNKDALALKQNFQNSQLFSDVSLVSLATTPGDSTGYPTAVSISVVINKAAATAVVTQ